jgi:outer membrane protein OmpA-like peptidoglycan-associated protein
MNHFRILPLLVVATSLSAQAVGSWVDLQGGYATQDHSYLKDSGVLGLGAGTWLNHCLGVELSGLGLRLANKVTGDSATEKHEFLSGLVNLDPRATAWVPYLRVGLGATQVPNPFSGKDETTTRLNLHGGLGVQGNLSEHFLGSLEARAVRIETQTSRSEYMALLGLGYRWGAPAAASAPAPAPEPAPAAAPAPEPAPAATAAPAPEPAAAAPAPAPEPAPAAVTPAPEPEPIQESPVPAPEPPRKIVLDEARLHFANGKAVLNPAGAQAVDQVASSLRAFHGQYTLVVTGYTSATGSRAANQALSRRRADAVAKELTKDGIPAAVIQVVGAGPDQPIADNKTKAGQAKNRRVEIEVKAQGGNVETRKTDTSTTE